jgi:hypothetical protein
LFISGCQWFNPYFKVDIGEAVHQDVFQSGVRTVQDVLDDGHDEDVAEDEEEDGVEVAEVVPNQGEKQEPAKYLEDTVNENLDEELKLVITVRVFSYHPVQHFIKML